jgi:hypothetical protein
MFVVIFDFLGGVNLDAVERRGGKMLAKALDE